MSIPQPCEKAHSHRTNDVEKILACECRRWHNNPTSFTTSLLLRCFIVYRRHYTIVMSFRQHKWIRWLLERSQESWKLVGQGVRAPQQFRQTLVQEAQQQNRTALSLLRTQKEWNDMRYYGIVPYLQQKMPISTSMLRLQPSSPFATTAPSDATVAAPGPTANTSSTTTNTSAPAKVAFMVTGRMKGQLAELGYSPEDIKSLTPVEASLLIEHGVAPADKQQQLPDLVQTHEEQQKALEQEKAAAIAAENAAQQQQSSDALPVAPSADPSSTTPETTLDRSSPPHASTPHRPTGPSIFERMLGSIASKNVIHQPTEISSRSHVPTFSAAREWYEVVENYTSGHASEVVALHPTEEEAEVDANLRLEIMTKRAEQEKKNVNVQYSIRKTIR